MTGRLDIVGLGPGGPEHRTAAAAAAVRAADVVIGYGPYVDQCADLLDGQEVVRGAMGEEAARADEALRRAAAGARVALVSSGDAGVHGMAARTLARAAELADDERPALEVIPGVTAALAAGALLGAPLGDDFAALSLSDLHVAWEVVERRLTAVAAAGLALALYNPRSRTRTWQLERVLDVLREHRDADTPVAVVTDAARPGQRVRARDAGDARHRGGDDALAARRRRRQRPPRGPVARGRARRGGAGVTVTLVGAGPGDPALLTGAARDALARADVVVYDRPSLDEVVALAPAGAERHCVGLAPGQRALPQAAVNALLVDLGRRRDAVVRLKSGDPFVASRGGEEASALREAGVAVRVVPGVSAALAAPAAAGIPLMLRQLSVTLTVVDGNDDPEHGAPPDWEALARLGGTLVILTGRGRIRRIAAKLMDGGLAPDTPIAAISAASRDAQRVLRGTLAALPAPLPPPVTFVIGAVAALDLTAPADETEPPAARAALASGGVHAHP